MPTVHANGIDIYFESRGSGEPVLLVAGFACDGTIWSQVVPRLTAAHRVIVFDNRGTGRTAASEGPANIAQMAADAAGLVDALGMDRVHVAGHSMGGMIAQELALSHPERVTSLMLLSTAARLDVRGKAIIESWGELPRQLDPVAGTRLVMPWVYTEAFFARPGAVEQVINAIVSNPHPPSASGVYAQSRAIGQWHSTSRLAEIAHPTLVLAGGEDMLLPVPFSDQLARGIRGAELVVLEQTGHGMLIESPAAVAEALLGFLARRRGQCDGHRQ